MRTSDEETLRFTVDRAARPTLTALWEGGGVTLRLPESGAIVVGRASNADIVIDHPSISRRHATLHLGEELFVEDLGSSNGTKVRARGLHPGDRVTVRWGEPFEIGRTMVTIQPAAREASAAPYELDPTDAPSMEETLRLVDLVAPTHISVLLLGETGVGKGYLAKRILERSKRADLPWLHLNCAALPEHLLESELFGHERGAFTGAGGIKQGLLEAASGGTVFLDEVGDLPASVQAKLLIALERGEVMRIGGLKPVRFDVRFVSATNRLFDPAARSGFRSDLYYRLAGLPIVVPPLRERRSEIRALSLELLATSSQKLSRPAPVLDPSAIEALEAHDWPGNIRELASSLERALLLCGPTLHAHHLGLGRRGSPSLSSPPPSQRPLEAKQPAGASAAPKTLAEEVGEIERRRIIEALDRCAGNQVRAAEALGMSRRTLISRMVSFGIRRPRKG